MGVISILKGLIVVLPVIISTMSCLMTSGVTYNLLVQKACSPGGPPEDINKFICPDHKIMDDVTGILSTRAGIQAVVSAVFGLIFGYIRDLTGKSKILMYVGIVGEFVSTCGSIFSTAVWDSSPWILVMIQAFASGGFGESIMQMGAACILMADSEPEELPMRMQLYLIATLASTLIGGLVKTVIVTTVGYLWLFVVCIGFHVVALLLIIFSVKNKSYDRKTWKESMESVKKVFKWRENVIVLWLMLIALATGPVIFIGEAFLSEKFGQLVFHFSLYQGQVFGVYSFVITIVGSIAGSVFLRKVFHCKDLSVGIIVCLANCVAAFLHAFVTTEVLLYLVAIAYSMKMASLPLPNSVISKILDKDELGTYLGINAILTACIPIGITRLYQEVSSRTIDTWVGAFYFVSSGCFLFLAAIFSISYCLYVEPKEPEKTGSKQDLNRNIETGRSSSPEVSTDV